MTEHKDEFRSSTPAPLHCSKCEADVVPTTPGHCPLCGGWVTDNAGAVTHGLRSQKLAKQVDQYRVGLVKQLFAERGGRDALDVVSRIAIENYALVCAQHKTIEARLDQDGIFTSKGQRRAAFNALKDISETINRLRAELPPVCARPDAIDAETLTEDGLVERLLAMLTDAVQMRDSAALAAEMQRHRCGRDDVDGGPLLDGATPSITKPSISVGSSTEEPEQCKYCYATTPAACAALHEQRPEVWTLLHGNDPHEIERREAEADERLLDEDDAREFLATGRITEHMHRRQDARDAMRPKPTAEEQRQAAVRRERGWDVGVLNTDIGVYRHRE